MELIRTDTDTPWHNGFADENGCQYGRSERGNVLFGDLSRMMLNQQSQYGSRYVDGLLSDYPNLGIGLEIEGSSYEEYTLAVAPADADELVTRIIAFRALQSNIVYSREQNRFIPPTRDEVLEFTELLRSRQLPVPGES